MVLYGIISKLRKAGRDGIRREIVFYTDESADHWSTVREDACVLEYAEAERLARQCDGRAEVLSAEQRALHHRQRQPALPGLSYLDP